MLSKRSIKTKAQILSVVPALIMSLLLTSYFVYARLNDVNQQFKERGQLMVAQLAPASEYGLLIGNKDILREVLRPIMAEPDVLSTTVYNKSGASLLVWEKDLPQSQMQNATEFTSPVVQENVALLEETLFSGKSNGSTPNTQLGSIAVALSKESAQQRQKEIVLTGILIAGVTLILAILFAYYTALSLVKPLRKLADALHAIRQGKLATRISINNKGELAELEQSVNEMAQALEAAKEGEKRFTQQLILAREQADMANQAKSQFLANVSHELRTPLNGTMGTLQILRESDLPPKLKEYVDIALGSSDHLLAMLNDLLDFSQIEGGQLELKEVFFSPDQLVKRCTAAFYNEAKLKDIALSCEIRGEPAHIEVRGDPTRLRQILINLLSNAIKFTEQGEVKVIADWQASSADNTLVKISVKDTGIGIDADKQQAIFEAFTQGEGDTTRRYGGTGLGLAIVQQLAKLMNASVRVKSRQSQGSTFTLSWTTQSQIATLANEARDISHSTQHTLSGKVLLVEDNEVNRVVTRGLLTKLGLDVDTATDGLEAVEKAVDSFDAILMDCHMPNMDGFEATRKIRALPSSAAKTPIIALTADAFAEDEKKCLQVGMDAYLSKPVQFERLRETLSYWMKASDAMAD